MKILSYNWAVWKNCRVVGYIRSPSEMDAMRKAQEKFGQNIFIERTWLGNPIPEGAEVFVSQNPIVF
jgi:hypothetical protein